MKITIQMIFEALCRIASLLEAFVSTSVGSLTESDKTEPAAPASKVRRP